MDGFFKNPSYRIAMSGRAGGWHLASGIRCSASSLKNQSIMPLGIFSCLVTF